jgi:hypothetical protein
MWNHESGKREENCMVMNGKLVLVSRDSCWLYKLFGSCCDGEVRD